MPPTKKQRQKQETFNQQIAKLRKTDEQLYAWPSGGLTYELEPQIASFIRKQLQLAEDKTNDYCIDNERWAKKSDPISVARYEYHAKRGCCGSHDEEVIGPDGETYLIGFNYGH